MAVAYDSAESHKMMALVNLFRLSSDGEVVGRQTSSMNKREVKKESYSKEERQDEGLAMKVGHCAIA